MPGITTILTVYRRPKNLQTQVEAIRRQSVPSQAIWAWGNEPSEDLKSALAAAGLDRVVTSSQNAFFHGRFALALLATTEYVALFDDDSIPGSRWFANCLETIGTTPGILGTAGVVLHGPGYADRTMHGWQRPDDAAVEVDLVGQAWFLRTEWIKHLFAAPPVTGTNGEDIELAARAWRLASVRSYCPPHPSDDLERWGSIAGLKLGCDEQASSLRPGHVDERERVVRAEMAAGWKPLFMRETGDQEATGTRPPLGASPGAPGSTQAPAITRPQAPTGLDRLTTADAAIDPLIAAVPASTTRILDCRVTDSGRGLALKQRQECRVVGIVSTDAQAATAGQFYDSVIVGNLEMFEPSQVDERFDCILLDGVLERVRDPAAVLRRAVQWLDPVGQVIARVANVREHRYMRALLEGSWDRVVDPFSTDRILRFFTARELEKLFYRQVLQVTDLRPEPSTEHEAWLARGLPTGIDLDGLRITARSPEDAEEYVAGRFLLTARPAIRPAYGLTSIVLVTFNQLAYTRGCLESIRWRTDEPYELIVVDNGSTDGTPDWLREQPDVRLIENATNCGFPAGANQGIATSRGDQVLLLNNDTLVTTGWLERMLAALYSDERIGLVGPTSNCVSGPQQIAAGYTDLAALDGFAWDLRRANLDRREETDRLVGFCLLAKRKLIDEIGLLDERFGIGNFEDDDYCLRATRAGYRAAIAQDSFVHHFGGRTFVGAGFDFNALMETNSRLFREKWSRQDGANALGERPAHAAAIAPADKQPPRDVKSPVRLSACLIVRDNARTIRACLESIRPWVDEIIVVDTGSKDETAAIARELGARVFHFPWPDSFSLARNESLRYAQGDWIFWMDSDDTIPADCGRRLRELALGEHDPNVLGYVMQVHCPGAEGGGEHDVTVVDHLKLFRNRPDLRFEFRIHEQLIPAIRRAGGEVRRTDIYVVHSGADHTPEGRERKFHRDMRLLQMDLAERPEHPFVLFNLGMTHADASEYERAIEYLGRAIAAADPSESQVRKAYALLVSSYQALARHEDAWTICQRGLGIFPKDPELRFREGMLHQVAGRLADAERSYRAALANEEGEHFSSIDRGIVGFKARQNLATVYADQGLLPKAEAEWRAIVAETPRYRPGWQGFADCLLAQGRPADALALVAGLPADPLLQPVVWLTRANAARARGDVGEVRQQLTEARRLFADDPEVLTAWSQHCFFHESLAEAESAVKQLLRVAPDDPGSWHNLGTIHFRTSRYDRACLAYRRSLALRPNHGPTQALLADAERREKEMLTTA